MRGTVALLVGIVLCSGCATMFSSGPETVTIKSDPPGARYQYGPYSGKTPDTIQASRKALAQTATFTMEGYEQKTVSVLTGIQGVTWWDILFWPGFIVDFVTGNAYKLETPEISAKLEPVRK